MEILLEKATFTGHEWHTKIEQVILHWNSFGKGYVHWTRKEEEEETGGNDECIAFNDKIEKRITFDDNGSMN